MTTPRRAPTLAANAAFVLIALIVACAPRSSQSPTSVFEDAALKSFQSNLAAPSRIGVYFDATASMSGFVAGGPGGTYARFVQQLERAIGTAWVGRRPSYFEFGSIVRPYSGGSPVYQGVSTGAFYTDPRLLFETKIEKVVETVKADEVSVVLTDLFQNEADVNSLTDAFRRKVVNQHLATAIWGIRSEFRGNVHDVGQQKATFPYDSRGDVGRYRPFYVILIGRTDSLLKLIQEIASISDIPRRSDVVLLSPDLLIQPLDWGRAEVTEIDGANDDVRLGFIGPGPSAGGFKVVNRKGSMRLKASIPIAPMPHSPMMKYNAVDLSTRLRSISKGTVDVMRPEEAKIVWSLSHGPGSAVTLDFAASLENLSSGVTFAVALEPVVRVDSFDLPQFCTAWTMDPAKVPGFTAANFDGTKTLNLREFVTDLWRSIVREARPEIGRIYLYLVRR